MERVKILLQLQRMNNQFKAAASLSSSSSSLSSAAAEPYKSIADAFKRIPREEGFLSFWRGNWTNVLRYFPTQALNFSLKDLYRKWLKVDAVSPEGSSSSLVWKNFVAGGAAGATTLFFASLIRIYYFSNTHTT